LLFNFGLSVTAEANGPAFLAAIIRLVDLARLTAKGFPARLTGERHLIFLRHKNTSCRRLTVSVSKAYRCQQKVLQTITGWAACRQTYALDRCNCTILEALAQ
jgi:hypothetical protein